MLLHNDNNNNRSVSNRSNNRMANTSKFVSAIGAELKKTPMIASNLIPIDSSS